MNRTVTVGLVSAALLFAMPRAASAQSGGDKTKAKKAPAGATLERAYKREFAFLEAEKRALSQRMAAEKKSAAARAAAARAEISKLQSEVIYAAGEAERISELMLSAEREVETLAENEDVGVDLLLRAEATLSKVGRKLPAADVALPEDADQATKDAAERKKLVEQLTFAFTEVPKALRERGSVRREEGAYYDATGKQVKGPILRIGDVASFGLVSGAEGPLSPAGEGRLKLWQTEGGAAAAAALGRGEAPSTLPLFVYQSLDKGVERRPDKTVLEVIRTGGVIAWVIVFLGGLVLLMVVARVVLLLVSARGKRAVDPILARIEKGDRVGALELAKQSNGPTGRVLTATIENLDRSRDELEDVVAEAVLQEQPRLERFGATILVLAAVSPLLGLLGTVTGMISTFDVITEFGTGNPKLLSGGISEALITTELGLIVAIPSLLVGHVLGGWSDRIRDNLDSSALAAVNRAAGLLPPEDGEGLRSEESPGDGDTAEAVAA